MWTEEDQKAAPISARYKPRIVLNGSVVTLSKFWSFRLSTICRVVYAAVPAARNISPETGTKSSLKTPEEAVSKIHEMAPRSSYEEIAARLNGAGLRSAFGRRFTTQHVGYICRRDGLALGQRRSASKPKNSPKGSTPS